MNTLESLGRRALKCSQWLWVPGMSYSHNGEFHRNISIPLGAYPDLYDIATVYLLGDIVAKSYKGKQTLLNFTAVNNGFYVCVQVFDYHGTVIWFEYYQTGINLPLAEALVLALENAGDK
jgi:hypothetical protein